MKKLLSSNVEDLLLNVVYSAAVVEFLLQNPGLSGKESPLPPPPPPPLIL